MDSERPETGSSQGAISSGLVMMITTSTIVFGLFYIAVFNNYFMKLSEVESVSGIKNTIITIIITISLVLTIYNIQARLPAILKDEETAKQKNNFMRGTLIPIGIMLFFVLFVFQFMMNTTPGLSTKGMLQILAIVALLAVGAMLFRRAIERKVVVIGALSILLVAVLLVIFSNQFKLIR